MNIPVDKKLLKRLKILCRVIKRNKNEPKKFRKLCKNAKLLASVMLKSCIISWEFIHDEQGREVRLEKHKKRKKKKKK